MGKTIGKPLGAYRRPIVCGLISLAKLPANLSARPPACFPDWKILGKVAGKLDIPITKPRGNLSDMEAPRNLSETSRKPLGDLLQTSRNLSETSRTLGHLLETSRRPLGTSRRPLRLVPAIRGFRFQERPFEVPCDLAIPGEHFVGVWVGVLLGEVFYHQITEGKSRDKERGKHGPSTIFHISLCEGLCRQFKPKEWRLWGSINTPTQ